MFNLNRTTQETDPFFEVDVLFGIEENPSFVSIIFDKEKYSVSIFLNEPESDDAEVKLEDNIEILRVKFENLTEAAKYYNKVRKPFNINKIINKYKNKEL